LSERRRLNHESTKVTWQKRRKTSTYAKGIHAEKIVKRRLEKRATWLDKVKVVVDLSRLTVVDWSPEEDGYMLLRNCLDQAPHKPYCKVSRLG